jgi:phage-related tail protein
MTQLSPITLVYDQIALSIANMLKKQAAGDYVTKQDILEDFNKNLKDIYDKVNSPQTSLELFSNSEPPSSAKMNKFINSMRDDINVSAKQLDFLNAKAVSLFNLFTSEIENEKRKINFSTFQELEPLLANFNFGYFFTF